MRGDPGDVGQLDRLRAWTQAEHAAVAAIMRDRRHRDRIRECHGDLHLGNIAAIDGKPVAETIVIDAEKPVSSAQWLTVGERLERQRAARSVVERQRASATSTA